MATKPKTNGYNTNRDAADGLIGIAQIEEQIRGIVAKAKREPLTVDELLLSLLEIGSKSAEIKMSLSAIYERSRKG